MSYGLASVAIVTSDLKERMQSLYYKILPLLGVSRSIATERQTLFERFQGLGLPNFVVDYLAAKFCYAECVGI